MNKEYGKNEIENDKLAGLASSVIPKEYWVKNKYHYCKVTDETDRLMPDDNMQIPDQEKIHLVPGLRQEK